MPDDGDDFFLGTLVICLLVGICFLYCLQAYLAVHLLAMSSALSMNSIAESGHFTTVHTLWMDDPERIWHCLAFTGPTFFFLDITATS